MKYGTLIYLLRKLKNQSQNEFSQQIKDVIPSSYTNNYIPNSLDGISRLEHNSSKYRLKAVKAVNDTQFMKSLQQEFKKIYDDLNVDIETFQNYIVDLLKGRKDPGLINASKYYKSSVYNDIDQFMDDLFSKVKSCTKLDKQSEDDFYQNVLKGSTFNIEPIHNPQVQNNTQITHLLFPDPTPPIQSVLSNEINLQPSPVQDDASSTQSALLNEIHLEQSSIQDDTSSIQSALPNEIHLEQSPIQDNALPIQSEYLDSTQPTISKHFNRLHRNAQNISSSDKQIIKTFIKDFSEIIMNCLPRDPTAVPIEISFLDTLENTLNIWDFKTTLISNESIKVDLLALCEVLKQYYDLFDLRFTQTLENNDFIYFCKDTEKNCQYFEHVVSPESLKLRQKIKELWINILENYK